MNKVRMLLSLLTVVIIVTPILGIVLLYRNNLQDVLIPPEITEITANLFGSDGSVESWLQTPKLVGPIEYDPTTRVITFSFNYTNSFPIGITINSLSGNMLCATHNVPLGAADLKKPVMMSAGETKTLGVVAVWTDDAFVHFQRLHPGENAVDIDLVDVAVDVGRVKIQSSEPIRINSVPIL